MEVEGLENFLIYAGYTLIMTLFFWLATCTCGYLCLSSRLLSHSYNTGTIGFFGTFTFVRQIYSVVKVD